MGDLLRSNSYTNLSADEIARQIEFYTSQIKMFEERVIGPLKTAEAEFNQALGEVKEYGEKAGKAPFYSRECGFLGRICAERSGDAFTRYAAAKNRYDYYSKLTIFGQTVFQTIDDLKIKIYLLQTGLPSNKKGVALNNNECSKKNKDKLCQS